jgi:putative spermidine/putrescine transport system substrate-binding protein
MGSNRSLLEFRFSLSQLSPHAADLTRRQLLRAGGRLAAVAAALLAGRFGPMPAVAAEVKLPEITAIPAQLKGSGVVRVCSYGGAFQDAQRKAYFEPFERLSGIKVIEAQGPDPAKVKAMVDTKNIEYDSVSFPAARCSIS